MTNLTRVSALMLFGFAASCMPYLPRYSPAGPEQETGYYRDVHSPALALLEYKLGEYFARGTRAYEVVCAAAVRGNAHDPDSLPVALEPDTELALLRRFSGLSPLTRCEIDGRDIVAADTGVAAAIFDVHELNCEAADNCLAWAGYYAKGPHGWSYYRLRFVKGEWRIKREKLDIIPTGEKRAV